jgi:hypothetical protein
MPFMAVYLEAMHRLAGLSSQVSINDIAPFQKIGLAAQGDLESPAWTMFSATSGESDVCLIVAL